MASRTRASGLRYGLRQRLSIRLQRCVLLAALLASAGGNAVIAGPAVARPATAAEAPVIAPIEVKG